MPHLDPGMVLGRFVRKVQAGFDMSAPKSPKPQNMSKKRSLQMPSFLPELTRRASRALAVAAVATTVVAPQAQAAAVSGQGTWETTLQGRNLDGEANTFEAYYDTVLNITWLADAFYAQTSGNYFHGRLAWDEAKTWAANLNVYGVTGWRLPDVKPVNGSSFQYSFSPAGSTDYGLNITSTQSELSHLYHVTLGNKSLYDTSGKVQLGFGLGNTGPFSNVQGGRYWSGVEYAPTYYLAWCFDTSDGFQHKEYKEGEFPAWAVYPGDVAAAVVPEPQTYALVLTGVALAVVVSRRRRT